MTSRMVHLCVSVLCQGHCSAGYRALQDTYLMRRLWLCNCRLLWELLWEMYFRGAKQPLLRQNWATCVRQSHTVALKLIWRDWSCCCHTFHTLIISWIDSYRVCESVKLLIFFFFSFFQQIACDAACLPGKALSKGFILRRGLLASKSKPVIIYEAIQLPNQ